MTSGQPPGASPLLAALRTVLEQPKINDPAIRDNNGGDEE